MVKWKRTLLIAIAWAGTLVACGGGGSAGVNTAGVSAALGPEKKCRNIASKTIRTNVLVGKPTPVVTSCAFDAPRLQLVCRVNFVDVDGISAVQTKTWTYGSMADFVNEVGTMGSTTSTSYNTTDSITSPAGLSRVSEYLLIPDRPIQGANTFANGKILTSTDDSFTEWDGKLRPTFFQLRNPPSCTGYKGNTLEYDDTLRQVTRTQYSTTLTALPGVGRVCIANVTLTKFDTQGNITDSTVGGNAAHFDVLETTPVCM